MAKCEICSENRSSRTISGIPMCENCFTRLQELRNGNGAAIAWFTKQKDSASMSSQAKNYIKVAIEAVASVDEEKRKQQEERNKQFEMEQRAEASKGQVMLTSAPTLEGYRIVEQYGLVFGETVFKNSFADAVIAGVGDVFRSFSFSAKEMKGAVSLLENGREFALAKLQYAAALTGANAVIGIATNNSMGYDTTYIQIYGTAVKVEKIS